MEAAGTWNDIAIRIYEAGLKVISPFDAIGTSADAVHIRDVIQLDSELPSIEEDDAGNLYWYINGEYLDEFQGLDKPAKYTISGRKRNYFLIYR